MRGRSILLLGASVRSLAWSARRAGFDPIGLDLFGDRDLTAVGASTRIAPEDYPHGFEALSATFPGEVPCVYSGAMENHPDLLDAAGPPTPDVGRGG